MLYSFFILFFLQGFEVLSRVENTPVNATAWNKPIESVVIAKSTGATLDEPYSVYKAGVIKIVEVEKET